MAINFGFDPISLISGIAQAQASAQAQQIAWANLQFQKEQARKEFDLATAERGDAYGNKVRYDPILKKWITELTPTQQRLLSAGEREQGLSLGEDAERNRTVKRRQAKRATEAEPDFNRALMGFRYDQPDSEDAKFSQLARLIAGSNEAKSKEVRNTIGRGALRLGRGEDIAGIVKASNDQLGAALPDTILAAREGARRERAQDVAGHNAEYLTPLQYFQGLEDDVSGSPQLFSNAPQTQNQTQSQMLAAITNAIAQGAAGVGNAYGSLANATANSGFRGSGLSFSGSFGGEAANPRLMTLPPRNSVFDPSTGQVLYTAPVYGAGGGSGGKSPASAAPISEYSAPMAALSRLIQQSGGSF